MKTYDSNETTQNAENWTDETITITPINETQFNVDGQRWDLVKSDNVPDNDFAGKFDFESHTFRNVDEGVEYSAGRLACETHFSCINHDAIRSSRIDDEPKLAALFACVKMFCLTF